MTKKLLREAKKIADAHGFTYAGVNGSGHFSFRRRGIYVVLGGSPKNPDHALDNLAKNMTRPHRRWVEARA